MMTMMIVTCLLLEVEAFRRRGRHNSTEAAMDLSAWEFVQECTVTMSQGFYEN